MTSIHRCSQSTQVITHILPIEDITEAFAIAANAEISGKVLVEISPS